MSDVGKILDGMSAPQRRNFVPLLSFMTTSELLATGISPSRIRTLVRRGDLVPVGRGVYGSAQQMDWLGPVPNSELLTRSVVALVTAAPGSVLSHHTAAQLYGLDLLARPPARVAITRPAAAASRRGKQGVLVHAATLPRSHVTTFLSLPVTTVARTVVDLARMSTFREGVVVADSAMRAKTSKEALRAVLADCGGWRGIRRAAQVVDFADGLSESPLESIARIVFRDVGLPPPELQVEVFKDGKFVGRVDFLWKRFRTIAEVDGAMKYEDPSRAIAQLRRDARLRAAGYEVVHFTWKEITEQPGQVAASIRTAFRWGVRRAPGPAA